MILALPILLVLSAFFSGSETALFNLTKLERMQLPRSGASGKLITLLLSETRQILITLLLGNMTVNVSYFAISSALSLYATKIDLGVLNNWMIPLITIGSLLAIILFGEVLPKMIAIRASLTFAKLIALPLYLVHRTIAPVRWFAAWFVITPLARLIAPREAGFEMSPAELESLLQLSQRRGVIDRDEEDLLQQVFELAQIKVRDLMVPRVDVIAFNSAVEASELIDIIKETKLRYIPIYEGNLDKILGVIPSRRALLNKPRYANDIKSMTEDVLFVPEQQRADELLRYLRENDKSFAIVVDEYGGTAGLITIEDIVEHMVGEIAGGYEQNGGPEVIQETEGKWRVSADLPVYDWQGLFGGSDFVKQYGALDEVTTIAGLVLAALGRLAVIGDEISIENIVIRVEEVEKNRVRWVTVSLHAEGVGNHES
ncbi:Magnesium and cobalt efflux protein CorC [Poriferisphaera corsica]|uniref:Magnesium and cobalt efflux protein CorC n=2 Tax=Poriferisphaera corsica TaxID=2528020 RepID=A0A517YT49_9BACT|nr:Magnesium and cobalt efflux protein CorC [Poriferisphaera corsica]